MGEQARNMYSISNSYNKYIQRVHQVGFSFINSILFRNTVDHNIRYNSLASSDVRVWNVTMFFEITQYIIGV
jgi:hypothetical protein